MLTKNKNPKASYIARVLVLPLAVLLFAAFTLKTKTIVNTPIYHGKKITVVLDAGHGGKDFGAVSLDGKILEKDLALSIVKKIKELNSNQNINIILTRQNDIYQTPPEKADFSKAQNPDLFISIHTAAASKESTSIKNGMSVYVIRESDGKTINSKLFASAIINEFANNYKIPVSKLPLQREIGIWVLKQSVCPAVLIEPGYITNKKDLAYLQTAAAKETIAKNILAAIERYAYAKEDKVETVNLSLPSENKNLPVNKTDTVPEINFKNYDKALIIADGEIISNAALKKIKPENIESIDVLKSKSAIAAYGAKAKEGVIIIKTKMKELVFKDLPITFISDSISENVTVTAANITIENSSKAMAGELLYVIDGKIQTKKIDINAIDPNTIQSVNVIKGEHALKKYGEAAVNGVIEITTKNKSVIKETLLPKAAPNNSLNEVVIVGYANVDTKNVQDQQAEPIFTETENEPGFPGGKTAWRRYLEKNLNSNTPIEEGWKPGKYNITVSFIVRKDGTIADIKTDDYPGSKTSEQCINLIRNGPKWEPAIQNGHKVNAYRKQPITFVVEKR